jgi:two-component system NtrC family sensor kinase
MRMLSICRLPGQSSMLLFHSIKGRIFILFAATFLSIVALTALNFWNLSTLKTRLLLGERYDDLLNNILEVRRFEKNLLFFNDVASLDESKAYLGRIDTLLNELAGDLNTVAGPVAVARFRNTLHTYEQRIGSFARNGNADHEELRSLGKQLLDAADGFLKTKRARIHHVIVRTSNLPFAFLGILLLLMVLVIKLISHGLLKPLDVVMSTTGRVARGDFSPIELDRGQLQEIACLVGAFNRMAQELETNQEDLLQARKIAAIGTFTAGIAHELNNPINNIALTAESFSEDYAERIDAEGREMIQDILNQADRAADIVKNLLDFSRTEKPAFSRLQPAEVLGSTLNLVKNQIKLAGLKFEMAVAEGLPPISGNLRSLQQVFMNLLLNAVQATPRGGQVTLAAELWSPQFVRFQVRDSGPGIAPEIRQQIFEPFFSTKEVGKGTGLGLAVSYSLIKRHGGRIEVANADGQGAIFSVFLPVAGSDEKLEMEAGGTP